MKTIWLLSLERVPTRYTWEWGTFIPLEIQRQAQARGIENVVVTDAENYVPSDALTIVDVKGELPTQTASNGGFLNWATTNIWKSSQLKKVAEFFNAGLVKDGDIFYVTDAWNPGILQIKYMSELIGIKVSIMGQWHAGAHDPWDFLGRVIKNKSWVFELERALFHAIDFNLFTTNFYVGLFGHTLNVHTAWPKVVRTGYPNGYLLDTLPQYKRENRDNNILFPHRIAPEKQLDIFLDLAREMPEYNWIVCQETPIVSGAMSLSPDRLSYSEMYSKEFLYPSEWTRSFDSYLHHKPKLVKRIRDMMENYETPEMQEEIEDQLRDLLNRDFIGGHQIWEILLGDVS